MRGKGRPKGSGKGSASNVNSPASKPASPALIDLGSEFLSSTRRRGYSDIGTDQTSTSSPRTVYQWPEVSTRRMKTSRSRSVGVVSQPADEQPNVKSESLVQDSKPADIKAETGTLPASSSANNVVDQKIEEPITKTKDSRSISPGKGQEMPDDDSAVKSNSRPELSENFGVQVAAISVNPPGDSADNSHIGVTTSLLIPGRRHSLNRPIVRQALPSELAITTSQNTVDVSSASVSQTPDVSSTRDLAMNRDKESGLKGEHCTKSEADDVITLTQQPECHQKKLEILLPTGGTDMMKMTESVKVNPPGDSAGNPCVGVTTSLLIPGRRRPLKRPLNRQSLPSELVMTTSQNTVDASSVSVIRTPNVSSTGDLAIKNDKKSGLKGEHCSKSAADDVIAKQPEFQQKKLEILVPTGGSEQADVIKVARSVRVNPPGDSADNQCVGVTRSLLIPGHRRPLISPLNRQSLPLELAMTSSQNTVESSSVSVSRPTQVSSTGDLALAMKNDKKSGLKGEHCTKLAADDVIAKQPECHQKKLVLVPSGGSTAGVVQKGPEKTAERKNSVSNIHVDIITISSTGICEARAPSISETNVTVDVEASSYCDVEASSYCPSSHLLVKRREEPTVKLDQRVKTVSHTDSLLKNVSGDCIPPSTTVRRFSLVRAGKRLLPLGRQSLSKSLTDGSPSTDVPAVPALAISDNNGEQNGDKTVDMPSSKPSGAVVSNASADEPSATTSTAKSPATLVKSISMQSNSSVSTGSENTKENVQKPSDDSTASKLCPPVDLASLIEKIRNEVSKPKEPSWYGSSATAEHSRVGVSVNRTLSRDKSDVPNHTDQSAAASSKERSPPMKALTAGDPAAIKSAAASSKERSPPMKALTAGDPAAIKEISQRKLIARMSLEESLKKIAGTGNSAGKSPFVTPVATVGAYRLVPKKKVDLSHSPQNDCHKSAKTLTASDRSASSSPVQGHKQFSPNVCMTSDQDIKPIPSGLHSQLSTSSSGGMILSIKRIKPENKDGSESKKTLHRDNESVFESKTLDQYLSQNRAAVSVASESETQRSATGGGADVDFIDGIQFYSFGSAADLEKHTEQTRSRRDGQSCIENETVLDATLSRPKKFQFGIAGNIPKYLAKLKGWDRKIPSSAVSSSKSGDGLEEMMRNRLIRQLSAKRISGLSLVPCGSSRSLDGSAVMASWRTRRGVGKIGDEERQPRQGKIYGRKYDGRFASKTAIRSHIRRKFPGSTHTCDIDMESVNSESSSGTSADASFEDLGPTEPTKLEPYVLSTSSLPPNTAADDLSVRPAGKLKNDFALMKVTESAARLAIVALQLAPLVTLSPMKSAVVKRVTSVAESFPYDDTFSSPNPPLPPITPGVTCTELFCRMGCVCESIRRSSSPVQDRDHCGHADCMLTCTCSFKTRLRSGRMSLYDRLTSPGDDEITRLDLDPENSNPPDIDLGKKSKKMVKKSRTMREMLRLKADSVILDSIGDDDGLVRKSGRIKERDQICFSGFEKMRPLFLYDASFWLKDVEGGGRRKRRRKDTLRSEASDEHNTVDDLRLKHTDTRVQVKADPIETVPGGSPSDRHKHRSTPSFPGVPYVKTEIVEEESYDSVAFNKKILTVLAPPPVPRVSHGRSIKVDISTCARTTVYVPKPRGLSQVKKVSPSKPVTEPVPASTGRTTPAQPNFAAKIPSDEKSTFDIGKTPAGHHTAAAASAHMSTTAPFHTQNVLFMKNGSTGVAAGNSAFFLKIQSNCNWESIRHQILQMVTKECADNTVYPPVGVVIMGDFSVDILPRPAAPELLPVEVQKKMMSRSLHPIRICITKRILNAAVAAPTATASDNAASRLMMGSSNVSKGELLTKAGTRQDVPNYGVIKPSLSHEMADLARKTIAETAGSMSAFSRLKIAPTAEAYVSRPHHEHSAAFKVSHEMADLARQTMIGSLAAPIIIDPEVKDELDQSDISTAGESGSFARPKPTILSSSSSRDVSSATVPSRRHILAPGAVLPHPTSSQNSEHSMIQSSVVIDSQQSDPSLPIIVDVRSTATSSDDVINLSSSTNASSGQDDVINLSSLNSAVSDHNDVINLCSSASAISGQQQSSSSDAASSPDVTHGQPQSSSSDAHVPQEGTAISSPCGTVIGNIKSAAKMSSSYTSEYMSWLMSKEDFHKVKTTAGGFFYSQCPAGSSSTSTSTASSTSAVNTPVSASSEVPTDKVPPLTPVPVTMSSAINPQATFPPCLRSLGIREPFPPGSLQSPNSSPFLLASDDQRQMMFIRMPPSALPPRFPAGPTVVLASCAPEAGKPPHLMRCLVRPAMPGPISSLNFGSNVFRQTRPTPRGFGRVSDIVSETCRTTNEVLDLSKSSTVPADDDDVILVESADSPNHVPMLVTDSSECKKNIDEGSMTDGAPVDSALDYTLKVTERSADETAGNAIPEAEKMEAESIVQLPLGEDLVPEKPEDEISLVSVVDQTVSVCYKATSELSLQQFLATDENPSAATELGSPSCMVLPPSLRCASPRFSLSPLGALPDDIFDCDESSNSLITNALPDEISAVCDELQMAEAGVCASKPATQQNSVAADIVDLTKSPNVAFLKRKVDIDMEENEPSANDDIDITSCTSDTSIHDDASVLKQSLGIVTPQPIGRIQSLLGGGVDRTVLKPAGVQRLQQGRKRKQHHAELDADMEFSEELVMVPKPETSRGSPTNSTNSTDSLSKVYKERFRRSELLARFSNLQKVLNYAGFGPKGDVLKISRKTILDNTLESIQMLVLTSSRLSHQLAKQRKRRIVLAKRLRALGAIPKYARKEQFSAPKNMIVQTTAVEPASPGGELTERTVDHETDGVEQSRRVQLASLGAKLQASPQLLRLLTSDAKAERCSSQTAAGPRLAVRSETRTPIKVYRGTVHHRGRPPKWHRVFGIVSGQLNKRHPALIRKAGDSSSGKRNASEKPDQSTAAVAAGLKTVEKTSDVVDASALDIVDKPELPSSDRSDISEVAEVQPVNSMQRNVVLNTFETAAPDLSLQESQQSMEDTSKTLKTAELSASCSDVKSNNAESTVTEAVTMSSPTVTISKPLPSLGVLKTAQLVITGQLLELLSSKRPKLAPAASNTPSGPISVTLPPGIRKKPMMGPKCKIRSAAAKESANAALKDSPATAATAPESSANDVVPRTSESDIAGCSSSQE